MLLRFWQSVVFTSILICGSLFAQSGLSLSFLSNQNQAQWIQPAYQGLDSSQTWSVGGGISFDLRNNALPIGTLNNLGATLSEERKDELLSQLPSEVLLGQRLAYGGAVNRRLGKWTVGVGYQQRLLTSGKVVGAELPGLVLKGNAAFEDQTVMGEGGFQLANWDEYALSGGYHHGNWQLGLRLKVLRGIQFQDYQVNSMSLYTAPFGEYLDLAGDYEFFQTQSGTTAGWGVGLDFGAVYQPAPEWTVQLAMTDLGRINWNGAMRSAQFDFRYEGIDQGNVLNISPDSFSIAPPIDSLQGEVWPDSVPGQQVMNLPLRGHIGGSWQFHPQHQVQLAVAAGPTSPYPSNLLVYVGYRYDPLTWLSAGVNGTWGTIDTYGAGAWVQALVPVASGYRLAIFAAADQAFGLLAPGQGMGLSAQGGITLGF